MRNRVAGCGATGQPVNGGSRGGLEGGIRSTLLGLFFATAPMDFLFPLVFFAGAFFAAGRRPPIVPMAVVSAGGEADAKVSREL